MFLKPFITEIIDHRKQVTEILPNITCEITTVGSCTTLIAERILEHFSKPDSQFGKEEMNQVCVMLSGMSCNFCNLILFLHLHVAV